MSNLWRMKTGERIRVSDMSDSHLRNAYRMATRRVVALNTLNLFIPAEYQRPERSVWSLPSPRGDLACMLTESAMDDDRSEWEYNPNGAILRYYGYHLSRYFEKFERLMREELGKRGLSIDPDHTQDEWARRAAKEVFKCKALIEEKRQRHEMPWGIDPCDLF